mmetsp:Transcript_15707/g.24042  ORF Transcript_15707/g.24042 Transcript_15707/m.24042 type:complete len:535 (+) Transcript_15707:61-1665(+)
MLPLILILLAHTITIASCTDNASLIASSNNFGYALTAELYRDIGPGANIWISPFCLCASFSVIYAGTTPDTNSRLQISDTLEFSGDDTPQQTVDHFERLQNALTSSSSSASSSSVVYMAHRLYISERYHVTPSYASTYAPYIRTNFDFDDKDASDAINDWVLNDTNGVIDEVIHRTQDIEGYSALAANVIFMNATFAQPFNAAHTSEQPFFTDIYRSTQRVYVHLMHQMQYFAYFESDEYQFVKFPLHDDDSHDLYILYVLPKRGDLGVISDPGIIENALQNLESTYVALAVPKLSIQATYRLKSRVKDLGIIDIFSDKTAQFSELTLDADFEVDGILHKTMIQTNEYGSISATNAAAASAAAEMEAKTSLHDTQNWFNPPTTTTTAKSTAPVLFKADHPFQMYIMDGSQQQQHTILCMGHIIKPGIPDSDAAVVYDESVDDIWAAYAHLSRDDSESFLNGMWIVPVMCAVVAIVVAIVAYLWHCHQTRKLEIERNVRNINKEMRAIPNAEMNGGQEQDDDDDNEHTVDMEESL